MPLLAPQAVSSGFGLTTPDGTWIVNDAGGAYEVDATGASRRIDNGVVQAAARDHRLVRECDESLQCSTVLVRTTDGERRVIDPALLPEEFNSMVYGMSMAPDGSAVSVVRSGANQQERVIIDLGVGEVASAPSGFWPQGSTWAADSSGIFDARIDGPGLQFVARTGEIVDLRGGSGTGRLGRRALAGRRTRSDGHRGVGDRERRPATRPDGHHARRGIDQRRGDLHRRRRRCRPELGHHAATPEQPDADQVR